MSATLTRQKNINMNRTKLLMKILITGALFTIIYLKLSLSGQSMLFEIVSDLSIVLILLGLGEDIIIALATLPIYLFFKTTEILKINHTKNKY